MDPNTVELIADLCHTTHPGASNRIEAVDFELTRRIRYAQLKARSGVGVGEDCSRDIVLLGVVKNKLMASIICANEKDTGPSK